MFYSGLTLTIVMIVGLIDIIFIRKNPNELGPAIGATVMFGLMPLIVGFIQRKKYRRRKKEEEEAERINLILRLAKMKGGVLSIAETSLELGISIDEAKDRLEEAVIKGICRVELDEDGNVDYLFPDLLSKN